MTNPQFPGPSPEESPLVESDPSDPGAGPTADQPPTATATDNEQDGEPAPADEPDVAGMSVTTLRQLFPHLDPRVAADVLGLHLVDDEISSGTRQRPPFCFDMGPRHVEAEEERSER